MCAKKLKSKRDPNQSYPQIGPTAELPGGIPSTSPTQSPQPLHSSFPNPGHLSSPSANSTYPSSSPRPHPLPYGTPAPIQVPQHLYQPAIQLQGLIQTQTEEAQSLRNLQTHYLNGSSRPTELESVYSPQQWAGGGNVVEAKKVYQQELLLNQQIAANQKQLDAMLNPYLPRYNNERDGSRGLGGFGMPGFPQMGGLFPQPGGGFPQPGGGFPQPGGGFPQPGGGFPQPGGGFPQPGGGFPQPGGGFPQPGGAPTGSAQAPTSPPPAFIPPKPLSASAPGTLALVDPGVTIRCLFRFTYVWLTNGNQFWYFPIFIGANSMGGFRWNGFMWMYFAIDLRLVDAITCS